jgi:hypothetical protein
MSNNTYNITCQADNGTIFKAELTEQTIIALIQYQWADAGLTSTITDIEQDDQDDSTFLAYDDYGYETEWTVGYAWGRYLAEPWGNIPSIREHAKFAYTSQYA